MGAGEAGMQNTAGLGGNRGARSCCTEDGEKTGCEEGTGTHSMSGDSTGLAAGGWKGGVTGEAGGWVGGGGAAVWVGGGGAAVWGAGGGAAGWVGGGGAAVWWLGGGATGSEAGWETAGGGDAGRAGGGGAAGWPCWASRALLSSEDRTLARRTGRGCGVWTLLGPNLTGGVCASMCA